MVPRSAYYLYDNVTWLPRHGYLDRATFDFTFRYRKRDKIASVGTRLSEGPDPEDPHGHDHDSTRWSFRWRFTTFAVGPFERKAKQVTIEGRTAPIPVEFNSVPARVLAKTNMVAVNADLILGELDNAVRYFSAHVRSVSVRLVQRGVPSVRVRAGPARRC